MSAARFRPELEGLRGLAVLLVVAAHAGWALPGAAIGPDLFFVLSGYLIVGLLLRRLDGGGGVDLRAFYARRLRRLAPAAIVAVLLTVGVVAALGDPGALRRAAIDGISALTGTANLHFAISTQDYFAPTEPSVFLPLWSLGIEEQFCLLVPLLIGAVYRRTGRRGVGVALALIALASTAAALAVSLLAPVWAYYLLPTRAYAIAIGGLLSLVESRLPRRWPIGPLAAVAVGVLLLVPAESGYPGIIGPMAALSVAALIAGSDPAMAGGAVPRALLAARPLRALGRISYSLFLLHWPALILPPAFGVTMDLPATIAAIGAAVVAATALYLTVERPFRLERGELPTPGREVARSAGVLLAAIALLVGSIGIPAESTVAATTPPASLTPSRLPTVVPSPTLPTPSALPSATPWAPLRIAAAGSVALSGPLPGDLRPSLADADRDADDVLRRGCGLAHDGSVPPVCVRGVAGGTRIVIIGTSHAAHWVPALEEVAAVRGYEIRPFVKVNCPFVDHRVIAARLGRLYHECHDWREAVIRAVNELAPSLVLIASARHEDPDGVVNTAAESAAAVARLLRRIEAPVAIIADNPYGQVDIPSCLARHREEISACVLPRSATAYGYGTARDLLLAERESLPIIDFTPTFCPNGRCAPIIDGIVVYHDHHHLTVTMSRHLAGPLGAAIDQIMAAVRR